MGITRILILALPILSYSCSFGQGKTTVQNKRYGYALTIPSSWKVDSVTTILTITTDCVSNELRSGRIRITTAETAGLLLDEYFKEYVLDWNVEQFDEFKIKAKGATEVDGKRALWCESQHLEGGTLNTMLTYLILRSDRYFIIEADSKASVYPAYKDEFLTVISSFKVD
jgi:hypothetical protein